MRISTGMMFDNGTTGILNNQATLFKLQNQLSTGRRVLTPSDDPVASAQALVTTQSQSVNKQYMENQGNAKAQLGLVEGNLDSLTLLLQDVRERSVQLGNATLTDKERAFIADELKSRFEELVGLGNAQNGAGQFLFSGFQGATKPFAVNPNAVPPFVAGANAAVDYFGDQGERLLQVEASRQMGVTASGLDVFMRIRNGNGEFAVSTLSNNVLVPAGQTNAGTALADQGTVLDLAKWSASPVQPQDFQIQFRVDSTVFPPVTYYNLVDTASGNSMFTNAAPTAGPPFVGDWKVFTPGQAIPFDGLAAAFGTDLGAQVLVTGSPADGDRFAVQSSDNQSIFDTFQNLVTIAAQGVPVSPGGNTEFMNDLGGQITALDRALENVLRVRATVGSRLAELDALEAAGSDRDLQYSTRVSNLQDLDYAAAISDLSRRQMQLEAAQASFVRITGLSLFSQI
ncbi:MAG TPA: flagellar hook-associated protein FlgL [Rhodocyclaceae bacterium]|nr:flagellar hook-associated protein FlgL [Rhodocyclaceae bacterium]